MAGGWPRGGGGCAASGGGGGAALPAATCTRRMVVRVPAECVVHVDEDSLRKHPWSRAAPEGAM